MTTQTKSRSYKREFIDKVKQKFYDLQSSTKNNKDTSGVACTNKKCKKCNAQGMAFCK